MVTFRATMGPDANPTNTSDAAMRKKENISIGMASTFVPSSTVPPSR